jgi:hypothetical protein
MILVVAVAVIPLAAPYSLVVAFLVLSGLPLSLAIAITDLPTRTIMAYFMLLLVQKRLADLEEGYEPHLSAYAMKVGKFRSIAAVGCITFSACFFYVEIPTILFHTLSFGSILVVSLDYILGAPHYFGLAVIVPMLVLVSSVWLAVYAFKSAHRAMAETSLGIGAATSSQSPSSDE